MTELEPKISIKLPSPPFHAIPGLPNFRDAGGYPINAQPGRILRPGVVFRSAEPSRLTDDGVACLQDLGITHVYDLRSAIELKRLALAGANCDVREWPGAQRVFVPVFRDQDYGPEAIALRYRNYSSNGTEVSASSLGGRKHTVDQYETSPPIVNTSSERRAGLYESLHRYSTHRLGARPPQRPLPYDTLSPCHHRGPLSVPHPLHRWQG